MTDPLDYPLQVTLPSGTTFTLTPDDVAAMGLVPKQTLVELRAMASQCIDLLDQIGPQGYNRNGLHVEAICDEVTGLLLKIAPRPCE